MGYRAEYQQLKSIPTDRAIVSLTDTANVSSTDTAIVSKPHKKITDKVK